MMDPYKFARHIFLHLPAETAHGLSILALKSGTARFYQHITDPLLATEIAGLKLPSPVGLAAGYDKNAEVPAALLRLGFGFVEVGTLTPRPQPGNPKPRIFRLKQDKAVVNRLGFNNRGHDAALGNIREFRRHNTGILGINLGANKDSEDRIADYVEGVRQLGPLADYLTINISSPNTPGLRALQSKESLQQLLDKTLTARNQLGNKPPLFLKVAPDLSPEDIDDISDVTLAAGLDGLIISNTTIDRPNALQSPNASEQGGLSGKPLFEKSTEVLASFYDQTKGAMPLIGVGGIFSGADAYAKICAGASAVQLYSALVYEGPGLVARIHQELAEFLKQDGFTSIRDAVGSAHGKS